jgi:hypothetical protein
MCAVACHALFARLELPPFHRNQWPRNLPGLVRVCCFPQQLSSAKKGWHHFVAEWHCYLRQWRYFSQRGTLSSAVRVGTKARRISEINPVAIPMRSSTAQAGGPRDGASLQGQGLKAVTPDQPDVVGSVWRRHWKVEAALGNAMTALAMPVWSVGFVCPRN